MRLTSDPLAQSYIELVEAILRPMNVALRPAWMQQRLPRTWAILTFSEWRGGLPDHVAVRDIGRIRRIGE